MGKCVCLAATAAWGGVLLNDGRSIGNFGVGGSSSQNFAVGGWKGDHGGQAFTGGSAAGAISGPWANSNSTTKLNIANVNSSSYTNVANSSADSWSASIAGPSSIRGQHDSNGREDLTFNVTTNWAANFQVDFEGRKVTDMFRDSDCIFISTKVFGARWHHAARPPLWRGLPRLLAAARISAPAKFVFVGEGVHLYGRDRGSASFRFLG